MATNLFIVSNDYPDVKLICERFHLIEVSQPKQFFYKPFHGLLQEGPQCGLVALAICMRNPTKENVAQLEEQAKNAGFTYNGEMYSANDMFELTKWNISSKVTLYDGILDRDENKEFLLNGGLMLVPYDTDHNFSPCLRNGHKAHWALITGIVDTETGAYVLAKQGKSLNTGIWSLTKLSESNAQLEEFSPERELEKIEYKLPIGGVSGRNGLKGKALFIWPEKH